jgi:lysophospholipase L1-like esterase
VSIDKPQATIRIIAVGGSTTFDTEVSADSLAWPARLEQILNQQLPRQHLEVINAGVAGYGVGQDLIRLETELYAYHPDLIIFYQGHNDLFHELNVAAGLGVNSDSTRPGEVPAIAPWTQWLERHSLLYTKIRQRSIAIRFHRTRGRLDQHTNDSTAAVIERSAQNFERRVRMYLAVARTLGIPVVVPEVVQVSGGATHEMQPGLIAEWQHTIPFAPTDSVLAGYARFNNALRSVAKAYNVPFIPMMQWAINGTKYYFPDDPIHFNDQGAERFASGLAAQLLQQHLIPPLATASEREVAGVEAVSLTSVRRHR